MIADEGEYSDSPHRLSPTIEKYRGDAIKSRLDASRWKAEDPMEMLELHSTPEYLEQFANAGILGNPDHECVFLDIVSADLQGHTGSLGDTEPSSKDHSVSDRSEIYIVGDGSVHVSIECSSDDSVTEVWGTIVWRQLLVYASGIDEQIVAESINRICYEYYTDCITRNWVKQGRGRVYTVMLCIKNSVTCITTEEVRHSAIHVTILITKRAFKRIIFTGHVKGRLNYINVRGYNNT